MGLDYFASASPTMFIPPPSQQPTLMPQASLFGDASSTDVAIPHVPLTSHTRKRSVARMPIPPSLNYLARASSELAVAGRKRSRDDDAQDSSSDDDAYGPICEPLTPKAEPIYGPGMTLIYPDEPQLNIAAESQSGTWMESKAEVDAKVELMMRPKLSTRKSQRRSADMILTLSTSSSTTTEIDPILLKLGIGWRRLDTEIVPSPDILGQQAFIRNQFNMNLPELVLHHEGMGIYVVRSKPSSAAGYWDQWWLFTENLMQCHFLCHDEDELFRRISNKRLDDAGMWRPDILVEGPVVLAKNAPLSTMSEGMDGIATVAPLTPPAEVVPLPVIGEDVEMS